MICSKCGQVVNDGTQFCRFCGSPLGAAPQSPAVQPPVYAPQPPVNQYAQPAQYAAPQYQQPVLQQQVPQYPQQGNYAMTQAAVPSYGAYNPAAIKPKSKFDIKYPGTIVTLLGCVLLLISLIVPYLKKFASVYSFSKSNTVKLIATADGGVFLVGLVLILIFLFTNLKIGVFVSSLLTFLYGVLEILFSEYQISKDTRDGHGIIGFTRLPGYYLLIVASVVILIGGIWLFTYRLKHGK